MHISFQIKMESTTRCFLVFLGSALSLVAIAAGSAVSYNIHVDHGPHPHNSARSLNPLQSKHGYLEYFRDPQVNYIHESPIGHGPYG